MALATTTVTGTYLEPDLSTPASGQITFICTRTLVGADQIIPPAPIVVPLDNTGQLAFAGNTGVPLAVDTSTPTYYAVSEVMSGTPTRQYTVEVPSSGPVDLSTLQQVTPAPMYGYMPLPSDPATGDVATWNGTAWVADAPTGTASGVSDLGTVGASVTLPAVDYTIATGTLTAGTASTIVLPHAVAGDSFEMQLTNSSGSFAAPVLQASSGETLSWLTAPIWVTTAAGLNIVDLLATADGAWQAAPLTSGLGPSAPIQAQVYTVTASGASVAIPDPTLSPYYQTSAITLSAACTISLPPIAAGKSCLVQITQPAGESFSTTWPASLVWATTGDVAPAAPGSGESQLIQLICFDDTRWLGFVVATGYGDVGLRFVQAADGHTGYGSTVTASLANPVTGGDLLVIGVQISNGVTVTGVSDNVNGTWSEAVQVPSTATGGAYGPCGVAIYYLANAQAGSPTITVTTSSSCSILATLGEYAGVSMASPLDQTASDSGTGTTASTGTTPAIAASGELVVAAVITDNGDLPAANVPAGWTLRTEAGYNEFALMDFMAVSTAGQTVTADLSASDNWAGAIAVFKP